MLDQINIVKKRINRDLEVEGILFTMVGRTNHSEHLIAVINEAYNETNVPIIDIHIPQSIITAESSEKGVSLFSIKKDSKVKYAYEKLAKRLLREV